MFCSLVLLTGCAKEGEPSTESDITEPDAFVEISDTSHGHEDEFYDISSALLSPEMSMVSDHTYSISINGVDYTFPFTVDKLLAEGWEIGASQELVPGQSVYCNMNKDGVMVGVTLMNKGTTMQDSSACNVVGFTIHGSSSQAETYSGIVTSAGLSIGDLQHRVEDALPEFTRSENEGSGILFNFDEGVLGYENYQLFDHVLSSYSMFYVGN